MGRQPPAGRLCTVISSGPTRRGKGGWSASNRRCSSTPVQSGLGGASAKRGGTGEAGDHCRRLWDSAALDCVRDGGGGAGGGGIPLTIRLKDAAPAGWGGRRGAVGRTSQGFHRGLFFMGILETSRNLAFSGQNALKTLKAP